VADAGLLSALVSVVAFALVAGKKEVSSAAFDMVRSRVSRIVREHELRHRVSDGMSGRVCTARGVRVGPRDLRGAAAACDARRHTLTATPRGVARSEAAAVGWRRRASSHGMTVGRGGRGRSCLRATGENGGAPVEEGCETEEHKAADSSNVEVEDVSKDVPSEQPGVEMWAAEAQEEVRPLSITAAPPSCASSRAHARTHDATSIATDSFGVGCVGRECRAEVGSNLGLCM